MKNKNMTKHYKTWRGKPTKRQNKIFWLVKFPIKYLVPAGIISWAIIFSANWCIDIWTNPIVEPAYALEIQAKEIIETNKFTKEDFKNLIEKNNQSKYKTEYIYKMTLECENRDFNFEACNKIVTSTGNACGLNQFTTVTWIEGIRRFEPTWKNSDIFNPEKNTIMMMHFINAGEIRRWACYE